MSNDHSSTPLASATGQTTADPKPVVVGSGVWFGIFWRVLRATDGGWWTTKKSGRMTYALALCRLVSNDGIKCWVLFAGTYKIFCGKKGQVPLPNTNLSDAPKKNGGADE